MHKQQSILRNTIFYYGKEVGQRYGYAGSLMDKNLLSRINFVRFVPVNVFRKRHGFIVFYPTYSLNCRTDLYF